MKLNVYHSVEDVARSQEKYVADTGLTFCKEFDYVMTSEGGDHLTMTESDDGTLLYFTLSKTAPLNLNEAEV